jgi:hypothetical protein
MFAAAGAGAEEVIESLKNWIFGRESTTPSWPEFFSALNRHDNGLAWKLFAPRANDELVGGAFLGS